MALGLVALTFAVFSGVRDHEFVDYDDHFITQNPDLKQGLDADTLVRAFTTSYSANWIPLTWISLHLNHAVHGMEPAGFLLTNAALQALAAVLLFLALSRMTGSPGASAFVAAVFAVHPLQVESVAWVAERKDALAGMFWSAALLAYAFYSERNSWARYGVVIAALTLGLLSKPIVVTLPLVLLLLDYWPLGRLGAPIPDRDRLLACVREKLPMFVLVAAVAAITLGVQQAGGSMQLGEQLPLAWRLENAVVSLCAHVLKRLRPSGLAAFYPHPLGGIPIWQTLAAGAALAAISFGVVRAAGDRPYLLVGWFWFLITLVPMLGLVQVGAQARADRYTYLPLIGLALAVAWGARDLLRSRPGGTRVLAVAAAVSVAGLALAAHAQVATWRDTFTLFERAVAVTDDNFFAHHRLGAAHYRVGRFEEAERHYRESLRLEPRQADTRVEFANLLSGRQRADEALAYYREAARLDPRNPRAVSFLADALVRAEHFDEARPWLERALASHDRDVAAGVAWTGPSAARLHTGLGQVSVAQGRIAEALRHHQQALLLEPGNRDARAQMGLALVRAGRFEEARPYLEESLRESPDVAPLHAALALVFAGTGHPDVAIRMNRRALELDPGFSDAANNLAWLLATSDDALLRDATEAVRLAEQAVAASGEAPDPGRLDTLAAALAASGRFDEAAQLADRAAELAESGGQAPMGAVLREHAALFRSGQPYREPAIGAASATH